MYFYALLILIMYLCIEGWSSMRAVSLLLSSRNLLMLLSTNVSLWPCVQCSVETVGALLMLSHWVGGWGNHCWSVGGQCSLPSLVFVILEQQCSGEMVSNQFNVKCRNKSFRQNGFISKDDLCKYNQFRMASFSIFKLAIHSFLFFFWIWTWWTWWPEVQPSPHCSVGPFTHPSQ